MAWSLKIAVFTLLLHFTRTIFQISHPNASSHTSWPTMQKKGFCLFYIAADRAELCIGHFVYNTSPPLTSVLSALWLNTLHCIAHVESLEKLSPALSSCVIIWVSLERSGCGSVCRSWCLHVCLWVGSDSSVSVELTGMAVGKTDTNLMCQVERTALGLPSLPQINKLLLEK